MLVYQRVDIYGYEVRKNCRGVCYCSKMRESGIEQNMALSQNRVPQNLGIMIIFPIQNSQIWGVYPIFRRTHMQKNEPGRRRARIQKLAFV